MLKNPRPFLGQLVHDPAAEVLAGAGGKPLGHALGRQSAWLVQDGGPDSTGGHDDAGERDALLAGAGELIAGPDAASATPSHLPGPRFPP